jgi:LmbE family N-acetylglucosaminyl deacetylase
MRRPRRRARPHRPSCLLPRPEANALAARPALEKAERFLREAASDARPRLEQRVAIVVAHPDDETLGCGALLPRLGHPTLIHVTDGAPGSGDDAARAGFGSPDAYAAARRAELGAALALAGVPTGHAICLGVPDQGTVASLAATALRLVPILAASEVVLTHAVERGHPDHDATALAVGAAARLLGPDAAPAVIAMPFYRAGPAGSWIRQSFAPGAAPTVLRLSPEERDLKGRMLAAHASQAGTLAGFGAADEPYRQVAWPDLIRLSQDEALYDRHGWGVTSAEFDRQAGAGLDALGLEAAR